MKNRLKNFINDPAGLYDSGVEIFEKIASATQKKNFLEYFKKNIDPEMLKARLEPYLQVKLPDDVVPVDNKPSFSLPDGIPSELPTVDVESLSDEQKEVWDELKKIRALQSSIHGDILSENNEIKRKQLVDELLSLEEKRIAMWNIIDNGDSLDPIEGEDPTLRGARLEKRAKQLRQNIARAKATPDKLAEYQKELEEIEKEINP